MCNNILMCINAIIRVCIIESFYRLDFAELDVPFESSISIFERDFTFSTLIRFNFITLHIRSQKGTDLVWFIDVKFP